MAGLQSSSLPISLPACSAMLRYEHLARAPVLGSDFAVWAARRQAPAAAPKAAAVQEVVAAAGPPDLYQQTRSAATGTAAGLAGLLALGAASPGSAFSGQVAKFGLASICGYQTVRRRGLCSLRHPVACHYP